MIQIVPTLFATTEEDFKKRLEKLSFSGNFNEGWVQIDLMDNKFVPNKSVDTDIIRKFTIPYKKEAQLMVINPEEWLENLFNLKVDRIIFPVEIDKDIEDLIKKVKEKNIQVGLSVNPETNVDLVNPYLKMIDAVLFMSVKPGLEGQKFESGTMEKIREIRDKNKDILIGVDGGIKDTNARGLIEAGANYLAVGSFLFEGDIDENVEKIWKAIQ